MAETENKALPRTSKIAATSRVSKKIYDDFYTLEYSEERILPENMTEEDVKDARADLWNTVNREVDQQVEEAFNAVRDARAGSK